MRKKILAMIMSIVMVAALALPAYAGEIDGTFVSDPTESIGTEDILSSDVVQDLMTSEGAVDITNAVTDVILSVGSIDIMSMGQERALDFVQNMIDMVGDTIVGTKTNVEVFADDPVAIVDNLFGLNIGEALTPEIDEDEAEDDTLIIGLGDVDGDGIVTAADARLVLRRAALLITFTVEQEWLADVDNDGDVTAKDARIIIRVAAGLESFE